MTDKATRSNLPVLREGGSAPFQFDGRNIRIIMKDGEYWFIASEVAAELGYDEAYRLTRLLDDDEKAPHIVGTLGGDQEATLVSEPGLYRSILQRRATKRMDEKLKSRIARFQRWVFHDVLPSIRKTGAYGAQEVAQFAVPQTLAEALRLAADQSEQIERLEAQQRENAPKVEHYEHFITSRSAGMNLQRGMATIGVYTNKAIKHLRDNGVFFGKPATPSKYYRDMGYFTVDPVKDRHDPKKVRPQTFVTPKGLDWLRRTLPPELFLNGAR